MTTDLSFVIQASDVHMYVLIFPSSLGRYAQFCAAGMQTPPWKCSEPFWVPDQIRDEAFITSENYVVMEHLLIITVINHFHFSLGSLTISLC